MAGWADLQGLLLNAQQQAGAFVPNSYYYGTEGGQQAFRDHVSASHNQTQADAGLTRAGQVFADKFKQMVGRDPSQDELSNFYKDVLKGESIGLVDHPNDLRPILNSYIADTYSQTASKEHEANLASKTQSKAGTIAELFKSTLGRDPSDAEKNHFAKLMAENDADEYEVAETLKMLPEYQEREDVNAREKLRGELSAADTNFYQQSVLPSIQSMFAKQGRTFEGSGFASALANSAKDINTERERYLAGLGREDYALRRQQSINSYLGTLQQQQADKDYGRARGDQLADVYRQRSYDLNDYNRQAVAYQDYLANYGRQKKGNGLMGAGMGAMSGAAAGAPLGPWGAGAGALAGGLMGFFGNK